MLAGVSNSLTGSGDYFSDFLDGECRTLGLTRADLEAWRPTRRIARKSAATPAPDADGTAAAVKPKKPRKKKVVDAETSGTAD